MSLENFRPREAYKMFQASIPQYPIGFRGQPHEYLESTLVNDFASERGYFCLDIRQLNWAEMRRTRKYLKGMFEYTAIFGKSDLLHEDYVLWDQRRKMRYFQQHPEKFCSMLVLGFPERKTGEYAPRSFSGVPFRFSDSVPSENIAGNITLQQSDFEEVGSRYKPESTAYYKQLQRRLLRGYINHLIKMGSKS